METIETPFTEKVYEHVVSWNARADILHELRVYSIIFGSFWKHHADPATKHHDQDFVRIMELLRHHAVEFDYVPALSRRIA